MNLTFEQKFDIDLLCVYRLKIQRYLCCIFGDVEGDMVLSGAERKFVVIVQSLYSLIYKPWEKAHCLITEKSYQFVCILTEVHALRFHHSLEGINVSAVHISLLYFQKKQCSCAGGGI